MSGDEDAWGHAWGRWLQMIKSFDHLQPPPPSSPINDCVIRRYVAVKDQRLKTGEGCTIPSPLIFTSKSPYSSNTLLYMYISMRVHVCFHVCIGKVQSPWKLIDILNLELVDCLGVACQCNYRIVNAFDILCKEIVAF